MCCTCCAVHGVFPATCHAAQKETSQECSTMLYAMLRHAMPVLCFALLALHGQDPVINCLCGCLKRVCSRHALPAMLCMPASTPAWDHDQQISDFPVLWRCNCVYALQVMNRWLAVRIDFISNIVVFATAILVSVVLPVNAGLAGLAITAAINLTDNLSWFVRMVSSLPAPPPPRPLPSQLPTLPLGALWEPLPVCIALQYNCQRSRLTVSVLQLEIYVAWRQEAVPEG